MRRPPLGPEIFLAAFAVLSCSKATNSVQPAAEPAAAAPAASAIPAPPPAADPAPTQAAAPPQPSAAVDAGREVRGRLGAPPPPASRNVQMACAAGGCSPDMKKGNP
jgi:hypothetical protein